MVFGFLGKFGINIGDKPYKKSRENQGKSAIFFKAELCLIKKTFFLFLLKFSKKHFPSFCGMFSRNCLSHFKKIVWLFLLTYIDPKISLERNRAIILKLRKIQNPRCSTNFTGFWYRVTYIV